MLERKSHDRATEARLPGRLAYVTVRVGRDLHPTSHVIPRGYLRAATRFHSNPASSRVNTMWLLANEGEALGGLFSPNLDFILIRALIDSMQASASG